MTIYQPGLDVSRWQCIYSAGKWKYPDFKKPAEQGVKWIKVRLAVGDYYLDPCFEAMYAGYRATGLYEVTPYIVFTPNQTTGGRLITGSVQVDYAMAQFTKMGFKISESLPWTGDYEIDRGCKPAQVAPRVTQHLVEMDRRGLHPVVYTRASWWDPWTTRGTGTGYRLHVAHYTGNPTIPPILPQDWRGAEIDRLEHQYSADGNNQGPTYGVLSPHVDLNVRYIKGDEPPPEQYAAITLASVNVRSGPGSNYPIVGGLPKGTPLVVLEERITGKWVRHDKGGWSCWQNESGQYIEEAE